MKGFKKKKFKVTFLIEKNNNWIEQSLIKYKFNLEKKYSFRIQKNYKNIKNEDIVFILNNTKILPENFLNKKEECMTMFENANQIKDMEEFVSWIFSKH